MNARSLLSRAPCLVALVILLALAVPASPAHAGGVVSVCDEAHLLAALAGGGTVTFACSGTITLTSEIVISTDTTIDGRGQAVTISGNHAVRVFAVNSGITLNLDGLTVANGSSADNGGGIRNYGTTNVNNGIFSDNRAKWNGGGIFSNNGTLNVNNSTFAGNSVSDGYGGGIANDYSTATVSNSTFASNWAVAGGDGIRNYRSTATMANITLAGNSGGGMRDGVANDFSTVIVSNSTLVGGGLRNIGGTVTLGNTIVANSPTGNNCYGAITDGGGNLSYPDATCPGINADPLLGLLQNNGGPTDTMALLPGSPAIDAADDAICAAEPVNNLDQRGIARPQGAHCDIGAFELEVALLPIAIDIKPDTTENVIGANKKGIIQVAILSSGTFDAPAVVDRSSLTFGRTGDESSLQVKKDGSAKCEPWDVNSDARLDLACHFWGAIAGFQAGDTEGVLKGLTVGEVPLEGRDTVRIVP